MTAKTTLQLNGFDHVEFAVKDLEESTELFYRLGFETLGERKILQRGLRSHLMCQGGIRVLLSQSTQAEDPVSKFVAAHGDGVINIGFLCDDTVTALEVAIARGATLCAQPKAHERDFGYVNQASIKAFGDVQHTFVSRKGELFLEGFESPLKDPPEGFALQQIDHITNNVERGALDKWAEFYETVFGFKTTRFFDIHTDKSGLFSKVLQSEDGTIKMPINEPATENSQIQEYLDRFHGPGVQHIALSTESILSSVAKLKQQGTHFLDVPASYYEALRERVPGVEETVEELASLGVLADGDTNGYLLQIFCEAQVGPFFFEIISRRGHNGFGEGNFTALFEAMEQEQLRRGAIPGAPGEI